VQLIYLSLPDGGDSRYLDALTNLWDRPGHVTDTIVPAGSPVADVQQYDHDTLHEVLVALLDRFQPTTIRIQDPVPDPRYVDLPEHADHVAAARFAQQAARAYEGPEAGGLSLLVRYRCYNTRQSPANVPAALLDPKTAGFRAYAELDPLTGGTFDVNLARNYHRFPVNANWVIQDGTGTLHAVVVGTDDVIHWRRDTSGWTGPVSLKSGSFAPGVAMARNANGLVQLAVLDLDTGAVLTTRQTAPGGDFDSWTSLGSPDGGTILGTPAFGVNAAGCLELYVSNKDGSLSNAFQDTQNGDLTGWFDVGGGPDIVGQPLTHSAPNGVLHVFADSNGEVRHWIQPPDGPTTLDGDFPRVESTATPSAATEPAGTVRLVTREYTDGGAGTTVHNGSWTAPAHLGGHGGVGPVAAVASGGANPGVLVFARNNDYGISLSRQRADATFGPWQDLGGYCEIGPAAITDADGLVRLLVVGGDCRLHERAQTAAGPDAPLGDWQVVGEAM
jgi:hypothetical protein